MSPEVLSAPPETPAAEALRRMMAEGRKWLVVADEAGPPLGLVDRQAMLEAIARGEEG